MLDVTNGLIGDRIPGNPLTWAPGHMLYDISTEHSRIIDGAILQAIREIEGNEEVLRDHASMKQLGKILHDPEHHCQVTIYWRGRAIIEVYPPEVIRMGTKTVITRRVKELWRQRTGGGHDRFKG